MIFYFISFSNYSLITLSPLRLFMVLNRKKIEEQNLLFKLLLKVKEFFYIFYVKKSRAQANTRAKRNRYKHTYLQYWLHRIGEKKVIRYTINDGVECYVEPGRERQTHPKSITILFSYRTNEEIEKNNNKHYNKFSLFECPQSIIK